MRRAGSVGEVFLAFLRLGLTSFGGPVAHLGYFRDDLVTRRRWMDDRAYADLVALCQFLPGPASSQVGFAMGLQRAGIAGALAAFAAFTLPSAVLLVAFAAGAAVIGAPIGDGILDGLKIVAVAIVAHAVWGMARTLAPDARRAGIAVVALALALLLPAAPGQLGALAMGVVAGLLLLRGADEPPGVELPPFGVPRAAAVSCLVLFAVGLVALPLLAAGTGAGVLALADAFFRSGALVFGGGHVVLPLLQAGVVQTGWVTPEAFLAGYGAAQAVPGPLFTFAAYLGAVSDVGPGGVAGAAIALVAIFLPGLLVLLGVLPFWDAVRTRPRVRAAMRGANAAVVGILGAALYTPVFTTAITGPGPLVLAVGGFVLLVAVKTPAWAVVLVGAAGGVILSLT
ncbi:chromate efflux transporter [Microbacterium sp. KSW4-17]|uniref:Chromate efflux transporter n=1 Tax=Microbacterium galbum TaxID=3075994 RepID=A0ABU3T5A1_9MICO|nr:chromate efflux transporter [Microbacterium sp. KSW4-17]MDU0366547.1 chromate efflux transporter [Microbacterium sp. KSW4-17]